MKDFYYLGKIVKTSGYKGNLVFFFDVDDIAHYKDLEAVFAEVSGELIPFAIRSIQLKNNNSAFVQLQDIKSEEDAVGLVGCALYLPISFLPPLSGDKFYYHEVMGYEVVDQQSGPIGLIESVIDQGPQDIFILRFKGKEILLPISDEIIVKVDRKHKKLMVNAPDGLLDIYL